MGGELVKIFAPAEHEVVFSDARNQIRPAVAGHLPPRDPSGDVAKGR